jgi:hypothetical protein
MQTVLDVPDAKFSRLEAKAENEGRAVLEIALRGIDQEPASEEAPKKVKRLARPIMKSHAPGSIRLNSEQTCAPVGLRRWNSPV